jgi:hypothetical protein
MKMRSLRELLFPRPDMSMYMYMLIGIVLLSFCNAWTAVTGFMMGSSCMSRTMLQFPSDISTTTIRRRGREPLVVLPSYSTLYSSHVCDFDKERLYNDRQLIGDDEFILQEQNGTPISTSTDVDSTLLEMSQHEQQEQSVNRSLRSKVLSFLNELVPKKSKLPPLQVEDTNLLLYDMVLIVNLAVSISFFVIHRLDLDFIGAAFNEGCLMCIVWILSGLYTGAFLTTAVDGHKPNTDDGGPKGATVLAANTFTIAINMRLLFALIMAIIDHRQVGTVIGEQIMTHEIGFGFVLMVVWRALHSSYTQDTTNRW